MLFKHIYISTMVGSKVLLCHLLGCVFGVYQHILASGVITELGLHHLCPFTTYCTTNASTEITGSDLPCCTPCGCTPLCRRHGNCCPDYEHPVAMETDYIEPECYRAERNGDNFGSWDPLYSYQDGDMYTTFTACPRSYGHNSVRIACERKATNLQEFVVVSDKYHVVYKNRFCAQCHGVNDVDTWQVKIICTSTHMAHNFNITDDYFTNDDPVYLQDKCILNAEPTDDVAQQKTKCFRALDNCNGTFNYSDFDEERKACANYTQYFITKDQVFGFLTVYQNVHCYLCNQPEDVENVDVYDAIPSDYTRRLGAMVSFSAVLNIAIFNEQKQETATKKPRISSCESGYIQDPIFVSVAIVVHVYKCAFSVNSTYIHTVISYFRI